MRISNQTKKIPSTLAFFPSRDTPSEQKKTNDIKINVINPKDKNHAEATSLQNSVISLHFKDQDFNEGNYSHSSNREGLKESVISLKYTGNSIVKNVRSTLDSQNINNETSSKYSSASVRNSNPSLVSKNSQNKKDESDNKIISLQPQVNLGNPPSLLMKSISDQKQKPQWIQNSKLLLDVSFNTSFQDKDPSKIEIDSPITLMGESFNQKSQLEKTVTELRKTGRLCESVIKNDDNKTEEKSSSGKTKMKLRDYLYMTQTSSKRASLDKHQLIQKRKSPSSSGISQAASPTHSIVSKQFHSPQSASSFIGRQNLMPKYHISNRQMFEIVKKQISQELHSIHESMNKIQIELQELQTFDKEPTNQQLLVLCDMRREIKEQIEKRVLSSLQTLIKNKKNSLLKSRKKLTNKQVQSHIINMDQFEDNC